MTSKKNWFIIITAVCSILFVFRISTLPKTRTTEEVLNKGLVSELIVDDWDLSSEDINKSKPALNDSEESLLIEEEEQDAPEKSIYDKAWDKMPEFKANPLSAGRAVYFNTDVAGFTIERYRAYGSKLFGRVGYNPNANMEEIYIQRTVPSDDLRRARSGMFKTSIIGFVNTITMTSGSNEELINEIEEIKEIYGSSRKGSVGQKTDFMIEFGFIIGAFICCFIIPIICWIVYIYGLIALKLEKRRQIKIILNSKETMVEYKEKFNSLKKLRQLNSINKTEYNEKVGLLRQSMYEKLIIRDNKRKIESEQVALQEALDEAFRVGSITEEEYSQKSKVLIGYKKNEP